MTSGSGSLLVDRILLQGTPHTPAPITRGLVPHVHSHHLFPCRLHAGSAQEEREESPMARISSRIGAIAPSATLAVDAKAKALKAQGRPVIGFGAGEPDFPTPAHIVDAAREALNDP